MTDDETERRLDRIEHALTEVALGMYPQLSPTNVLAGSAHAMTRVQMGAPSLYAITRVCLANATERRTA